MKAQIQAKTIFILLATILAAWQLSYTVRFFKLTPEQEENMTEKQLKTLHTKAIKLGLDLQGGVHLVLKGKDKELSNDETQGALGVLRNRIDQFGVSEPQIAKQGSNRISVDLPGVVDVQRAKEIIGKTAQLEFRLVEKPEFTMEIIKKIDEYVYKYYKGAVKDTSSLALKDTSVINSIFKDSASDSFEVLENPVLSLMGNGYITDTDIPELKKYLSTPGVSELIPSDDEFLWSKIEEVEYEKRAELLLVKKEACLKGDAIVDAQPGIGTNKNSAGARTDLTMTGKAKKEWARITGANVNRRIAIVMDEVVQSAPVVIERIGGGKSQIDMGTSPFKEAQDLALIIRAGKLPAPLEIVEERTVGPALGKDSIRAGMKSMLISSLVVVLFMLFYYKGCGLLADFALFFNIFYLLAILSAFKATLTMPGLAGIALTVGMGVDANILIYERIKEEMRAGKTVRAAIDAGYARAFSAIFDSNVTTLIAAIVLYYFGIGPVKGFGITLAIGVIANLFTAIVITKVVLDVITLKGAKRLSI
ncbi:MAG: protein translocase subunit SecD [bacterium]